MKIAYFSSKYPYATLKDTYLCGGSIMATKFLVDEISKMGHNIDVFTSSYNSQNKIQTRNNTTIYRYATNFNLMSTNISLGLLKKPLKYHADIVHISFDIPPGPIAGFRFLKEKNIPSIVTYHGDWDSSYGNIIRRLGIKVHNEYFVDKLLSKVDIIISPSKYYLNESKFLNKYKKKVNIIPNGINLDEFNIDYSKEECREILGLNVNQQIILFVGNLSPYKGPDILIKAMKYIKENSDNINLIICGTGPMEDELKNLCRKLDLDKKIKFVGYVNKLKALYYKSSDIFVLPSITTTESFGIVNLEAMASGIPIIASNIGGIPDLVKDNENGLLVKPKDPKILANALIYLLNNKKKREKMGKFGNKKVKNYSWENIAKKTELLYKSLT